MHSKKANKDPTNLIVDLLEIQSLTNPENIRLGLMKKNKI